MTEKKKISTLRESIGGKDSLLVAFSGGVDSSVIARIAREELGERALAVTVDSDTFSSRELKLAREIAGEIGIQLTVVTTSELDHEAFTRNPVDRCYHCKHEELRLLQEVASERGISDIAFGVTPSDFSEHRPGIRALQESGVFLPLVEAGLDKSEIASLARELGLSNFAQPSTTCLASRIPYHQAITAEKLQRIEKAEDYLLSLGIRQVRVRLDAPQSARIEVDPGDLAVLVEQRLSVTAALREMGFDHVALDLEGYRSGSMNRGIDTGGVGA